MGQIITPLTKEYKNPKLRVFYGWNRISKVRKKEAISVIFENEAGAGTEPSRSYKTLCKMQNTVYVRIQTEEEAKDARNYNRVFTEYNIFMDDKSVNGSLKKALHYNSMADKNHVSLKERREITERLRISFLAHHIDYKEPTRQLEIEFE